MKTLGRITRACSLLLPLALIVPLMSPAPAAAGEAAGEAEKDYDFGFKVRIELRMENGDIVKHRGEIRSFGTDWRFEFDGADHHHVLTLALEGEEGQKNYDVTLAYERDAMDVIAPYTDSYPVRKRQSLWTTDGKLAVALTFIPYKFEREDQSRDDGDQVNPDGNDDPLGGNLFK